MQKQFTTSSGWKNDSLDVLFNNGIFVNCYGENTGNNIFSDALNTYLLNPISLELISHWNDGDVLFWCPANYLYNLSVVPTFSDILLKKAASLIVFGIGIQATSSINEITLIPETQQFLKELSSQGARFISRGSYSELFLDSIGIKTSCLGCPSILTTTENTFTKLHLKSIKILETISQPEARIGLSFTGYIGSKFHRDSILNAIKNKNVITYLAQTEINLYKYLINIQFDESSLEKEKLELPLALIEALTLSKKIIFELNPTRLSKKINNSIDFYISERIHGAIFAILSGVPTIVCCCDLRTLELCRLLGIPYFSPKTIQDNGENISIELIASLYLAQIGSFEVKFQTIKNNLVKFLSDNQIQSANI